MVIRWFKTKKEWSGLRKITKFLIVPRVMRNIVTGHLEFRWLGTHTYIRNQYITSGWEDGDSKCWDNLFWVPKDYNIEAITVSELYDRLNEFGGRR